MARKVWTAGTVLAAADVNNYLMDQTVPRFASAADRDAQWPNPPAGAMCALGNALFFRTTAGWSPLQAWSMAKLNYAGNLPINVATWLSLTNEASSASAPDVIDRTSDVTWKFKVPGTWLFHVNLGGVTNAGVLCDLFLSIYRGGSVVYNEQITTTTQAPWYALPLSALLVLNANDEVGVRVNATGGGMTVDNARSRLIGHLLHPSTDNW